MTRRQWRSSSAATRSARPMALSRPITWVRNRRGPTEPRKRDKGFRETRLNTGWELTRSPAGAKQWTPKNPEAKDTVPDAHDPSKRHAPMMLTTELALREDPIYREITTRWRENPEHLAEAFAKAWYKLLHRDMG